MGGGTAVRRSDIAGGGECRAGGETSHGDVARKRKGQYYAVEGDGSAEGFVSP